MTYYFIARRTNSIASICHTNYSAIGININEYTTVPRAWHQIAAAVADKKMFRYFYTPHGRLIYSQSGVSSSPNRCMILHGRCWMC